MSILETRVAPIIVPLIRGESIALDDSAQITLARWIAKTTMTADTVDPSATAIPDIERAEMRLSGIIPTHWRIWIGQHRHKDWETAMDHIAVSLRRPPIDPKLLDIPNTQSTTFGIGKLLIYSISSTFPHFRFSGVPPEITAFLFRLWPLQRVALTWPQFRAISNANVERLGSHLYYSVPQPIALADAANNTPPPYPGQGHGVPASMGKGQWVIENAIFITADGPDLGRPPPEGRTDPRATVKAPNGNMAFRFEAAQIAAEMNIKTATVLKANRAGELAVSWTKIPPRPGSLYAVRFSFSFKGRSFAISVGFAEE